MIKIIKSGDKKYQIKCNNCGCIFSFLESDILEIKYPLDPNTSVTYSSLAQNKLRYIECPECTEELLESDFMKNTVKM